MKNQSSLLPFFWCASNEMRGACATKGTRVGVGIGTLNTQERNTLRQPYNSQRKTVYYND